ncbi:MAG: hypothetical protein GXO37_07370 [Chloroflexi bacterium]|nr:hypothetical protein [Chloroflexota bacterium]
MNTPIVSKLRTWARPRIIAGLAVVTLVYGQVLGRLLRLEAAAEPQAPDMLFFYTPARAYALLAPWAADRFRFILAHLLADGLYPLLYGTLLALLLLRVHPTRPHLWRIPALAVLTDWLENLLLSVLLWAYPRRWDALAWLAGLSTALKWSAVAVSLALIVGGWLFGQWQRRRTGSAAATLAARRDQPRPRS